MSVRRALFAATSAAAVVLAAAGCAAGSRSTGPAAAPGSDQQVSLTVWSNYTDRELGVFDKVLDGFHAKHPNITVRSEGSQDDDKITQSIRSGNPPDVAVSFSTENVGQFCGSGGFVDLKPYLDRDSVDLNQFPKAVRDYTGYDGKQCSLPMLADVYGMFYNKDLFAGAGISAPPKTMSELAEDARKLTQRNPDGSIKVAGFLPSMGFYANHPQVWAPQWGAQWLGKDGRSDLATDPAWRQMFTWQKQLVDFYGWDNLQKFTAGLGQEYGSDHAFNKGQVAMVMDGEFRTAFLADQAPQLNYGTAPSPVADDRADLHGGGFVTGTVLGLPRGAKNAGAAWELIKYLATDTGALEELANGLKNVPSTLPALKASTLRDDPHFTPFLDMFANPHLAASPAYPNGNAYIKSTEDFGSAWQSGKTTDLVGGLAKVDQQINDSMALGGK